MKKKNKSYSTHVTQKTDVVFESSLSGLGPYFKEPNIILIDKKLRRLVTVFSKKDAMVVFLEGSESTKSLKTVKFILEKIFNRRNFDLNKKTKIVVIGGGTLGDFGGFLAHILKRGLPLVLVPSTWLSAIDSAHGGKNGINFKSFKNQIGTIYPAQKVILIKDLLETQSKERDTEGYGELIKIAYINSKAFYNKVAKLDSQNLNLFSYLPAAIHGKYKVVSLDPHETKGIRFLLNLGHTIGHVWESSLKIHHGISVLLGIYFDFLWAYQRGFPVENDLVAFINSSVVRDVLSEYYTMRLFSVNEKNLERALSADKKKESKNVRYVFPYKAGQLKIESVTIGEIISEYRRQKKWFEQNRGVSFAEI